MRKLSKEQFLAVMRESGLTLSDSCADDYTKNPELSKRSIEAMCESLINNEDWIRFYELLEHAEKVMALQEALDL